MCRRFAALGAAVVVADTDAPRTSLIDDGIANLRVVDASIMPTITTGNTNAPSMMIGERAAELILGARRNLNGVTNGPR